MSITSRDIYLKTPFIHVFFPPKSTDNCYIIDISKILIFFFQPINKSLRVLDNYKYMHLFWVMMQFYDSVKLIDEVYFFFF